MGLVANIRRDMRFAKGLRRLLKRIKPIDLDSADLVCDDWEEAVDKFPDHVAIQDDRLTLTYRELDAMANRFGHWAQSRRLKRGDTIALMMLNRAEYIAAWMGFSQGDQVLLAVLVGSASYIAAPAAMRSSIPDANPSLYLAMPLALTFPMNLIFGIPLYIRISHWLH